MDVLRGAVAPQTVRVELETLTPIYTGGITQDGEQLHPSGLLGSIRRFSCLLAAAVGDHDFERACWGGARESENGSKAVALDFDTRGLKDVVLPGRVQCDGNRGWFFRNAAGNPAVAKSGTLAIALTPYRGLEARHMNLLKLALRIQIRRATLGAKDQFGLGVVQATSLPDAEPLHRVAPAIGNVPGLQNAFFALLRFGCPAPDNLAERIRAGLCCRRALRDALRRDTKRPGDWRDRRHYVMGWLDTSKGSSTLPEYGSAVNVSAVYPLDKRSCEIRVWGVVPHTCPPQFSADRVPIITRLRRALAGNVPVPHDQCGIDKVLWCDVGDSGQELVRTLNKLAGL